MWAKVSAFFLAKTLWLPSSTCEQIENPTHQSMRAFTWKNVFAKMLSRYDLKQRCLWLILKSDPKTRRTAR